MTDDQLRFYVSEARRIAKPIGPMHSLWDTIFDAEAILAGEPSILKRQDIEQILLQRCSANPNCLDCGGTGITLLAPVLATLQGGETVEVQKTGICDCIGRMQ